jgi:mannose-6-phosphate isomerase-like protein (cupin superfamily)
MRLISTSGKRKLFNVLQATAGAQAAMMTLRPGRASSDEVENEHPRSEQWLFVVQGSGRATVGRRRAALRVGSLLVIEKREPHRIVCTGRQALVTLNLYIPPAYTPDGEVRPSAK